MDVSDGRLATVPEALRDETRWSIFEGALNQHTSRVYDLQPPCVRLYSTTANGHWAVEEDGVFQFGHSNDCRPDLPQVKIMVSALDPLGMSVATDAVPGQRADDPLFGPAITRVREGLRRRGLLYVSNCKMGVLETRASIQASVDYYLCPLSETQLRPPVLSVGSCGRSTRRAVPLRPRGGGGYRCGWIGQRRWPLYLYDRRGRFRLGHPDPLRQLWHGPGGRIPEYT